MDIKKGTKSGIGQEGRVGERNEQMEQDTKKAVDKDGSPKDIHRMLNISPQAFDLFLEFLLVVGICWGVAVSS